MVAFIRTLIERGGEGETALAKPVTYSAVWHSIMEEDERIRYLLKQFPNGPLMKALDVFREDSQLRGFDPLSQDNLPTQLFTAVGDEVHLTCLRLPSPTFEALINKAEMVVEFSGFLERWDPRREIRGTC